MRSALLISALMLSIARRIRRLYGGGRSRIQRWMLPIAQVLRREGGAFLRRFAAGQPRAAVPTNPFLTFTSDF